MSKTTYTQSELKKLKKADLLNVASELGLKNVSRLKKDDLIAEILENSKEPKERFTEPTKKRQVDYKDSTPEIIGESRKFETQEPSQFYEPAYPIETRELPGDYGDTKIVLMVRDPHWVYTYWEINDQKREELGIPKNQHKRRVVLRVCDVTDVDYNGSNANSFFDIDIDDNAINWYLKIPEPNRDYCIDLGYFDENGNFILIARSNVVRSPRDTMSDITDEEWMGPEEQFMKIFGASGGHRLNELMGSQTLAQSMSAHLEQQLSSGVLSSGALQGSQSAVPEQVAEKEKSFWFWLNTELIVYGGTEPDATVTVQGKKIDLNPDGTFSLRFALPDGEQVIPARATNADGDDTREITPIVKKETK